ncbi:hypothetical protein [Stenotrophomonas sp. PD6]|uniref:hypothetical protein n=1 Tax=Stenotrophomonas sp. PD6 TaxID=3368612 RepID=UPI003BA0BF01
MSDGALPGLPAPPATVAADAGGLARYGDVLLQAMAARDAARPAADAAAGQGLIALLAQIARTLQSADPGQLRRQTGWWGRLLGRDVEHQQDGDAWRPRLGLLLVQAEDCARAVQGQGALRAVAVAHAHQGALALDAWAAAAAAQMPGLSEGLQAVLAQRVDHLRRLALLQQTEAAQWQLLQAQDEALLARFRRIADILLPAWQQAVLARQADGQRQRDVQATQLQAQIAAEVASAQARLE